MSDTAHGGPCVMGNMPWPSSMTHSDGCLGVTLIEGEKLDVVVYSLHLQLNGDDTVMK